MDAFIAHMRTQTQQPRGMRVRTVQITAKGEAFHATVNKADAAPVNRMQKTRENSRVSAGRRRAARWGRP
jgi:hypothetical protein